MKVLRQMVERVVRPLRANQRTKDRMREELLEHLELLYEQEREHLGDAAALNAAARRFGEPQVLTRELQASVPRLERWAFVPLPGSRWSRRRMGEKVSVWVVRTTTAGSLASGLVITLAVVILAAWEHRLNRLGPVAPFLLAFPVLMWVSLASIYGFCELIRHEIEGGDLPEKRFARHSRIVGLVILSMIPSAVVSTTFVMMVRVTSPSPLFSDAGAVVGCVGWGILMVFILAIQLRDWVTGIRRFDNWESLDLEGDPAS